MDGVHWANTVLLPLAAGSSLAAFVSTLHVAFAGAAPILVRWEYADAFRQLMERVSVVLSFACGLFSALAYMASPDRFPWMIYGYVAVAVWSFMALSILYTQASKLIVRRLGGSMVLSERIGYIARFNTFLFFVVGVCTVLSIVAYWTGFLTSEVSKFLI